MQHFTLDQIKQIIEAVPTACKGSSKLSSQRKQLMILVTFWHGLRASETCALRGENIKHGYVRTPRLKGSNSCAQPYQYHPDPLLDESAALTELSAKVGDRELIFPLGRFGFNDFFKKAVIHAGLNPLLAHPHVLKHSIAMATIKAGIEVTRQRLGHKNLSSTGFYLNISEETAATQINTLLGI